jgi:hypothetical protein
LRATISVPELRPKSVPVQFIVATEVAKALADQLDRENQHIGQRACQWACSGPEFRGCPGTTGRLSDGVPLSLPQCWVRTIAVGSPQRPLPYYDSAGLRRRGHPAASSFFSERALPQMAKRQMGRENVEFLTVGRSSALVQVSSRGTCDDIAYNRRASRCCAACLCSTVRALS